MNFKNLPKEKRNQLLLVCLISAGIVAGLGFGLIKGQYRELAALNARNATSGQKLHQVLETVKQAQRIENELAEAKNLLSQQEQDMATGDLYSWVIMTFRDSMRDYRVNISQFSPISQPMEVNLLPRFPYKQATLTIVGTAHFHDFGRFLADFENKFPHIRLTNLVLDSAPTTAGASEDSDLLAFKMDVVTLVKPSAS